MIGSISLITRALNFRDHVGAAASVSQSVNLPNRTGNAVFSQAWRLMCWCHHYRLYLRDALP
jgi:hypothetical protein